MAAAASTSRWAACRVYVSKARLGGLARDGYYGPPELLVEVLSSRPALDTEVKMESYARAGVPSYWPNDWIVDPERYTLRAYELDQARWKLVAERRDEDTFEPALLGPALGARDADLDQRVEVGGEDGLAEALVTGGEAAERLDAGGQPLMRKVRAL